MRILIAEDEVGIAKALKLVLEKNRFARLRDLGAKMPRTLPPPESIIEPCTISLTFGKSTRF